MEIENDYISRQAAIEAASRGCLELKGVFGRVENELEMLSSADVVPRSIFEQVKWERDIAMKQLEDLGIGFGEEVKDVVEVVRCKDCKHRGMFYGEPFCELDVDCMYAKDDWYCPNGERRTDGMDH